VEVGNDGVIVHDIVREVAAAFLRSSDPDRSRRYRVAAWRQLRDEVARAAPEEMWRYTADLLYILENPVIREAFFPTTEHLYFVEAAQPADWPAIAEIISLRQPGAASILATWWARARCISGCSRRLWRHRRLLRGLPAGLPGPGDPRR
jgi:hypothetical protein